MSAPPPYNRPGAGGPPPYQGGHASPPGYLGSPPGYPPTPPKKSNTVWWVLGGGLVGLLALCACIGLFSVGAIGGSVVALFRATAGPRDATTAYYEAVAARDYATAQSYLNSPLRSTITPRALEATWKLREAASGPVVTFDISGTNISTTNGNTTATVTGTLRYTSGASEPKTVTLVKEGDDWRISSAP